MRANVERTNVAATNGLAAYESDSFARILDERVGVRVSGHPLPCGRRGRSPVAATPQRRRGRVVPTALSPSASRSVCWLACAGPARQSLERCYMGEHRVRPTGLATDVTSDHCGASAGLWSNSSIHRLDSSFAAHLARLRDQHGVLCIYSVAAVCCAVRVAATSGGPTHQARPVPEVCVSRRD